MPDIALPGDNRIAELEREIAVLRRQLAERSAERDEALAQQSATAEVLQVINSSAGDLAPVFDTILEQALRRCEASFGGLFVFDGERFQLWQRAARRRHWMRSCASHGGRVRTRG